MDAPPRPVVLLLALTLAPLAGCIGPSDEAPAADVTAANTSDDAQDATLPDGREFAAAQETNKTEEGIGGVDHKHDYWKGLDRDVVFDELVHFSSTPIYPDGPGTAAKSVAYVKLPSPKLVYEGASEVHVLAEPEGLVLERRLPTAPNPNLPSLKVQYRTAVDADWREPQALPYGEAVVLPVGELEADMPHSVTSLWVFRITTDQPVESYAVKLTVTAFKGKDVADWPGHPDFYADSNVRVVLDKDVQTHMSGITEGILYDSSGTWAVPDRLISHGTNRLEVYINVTGITTQTGQQATGYFLESHNATVIGPEITFGRRWGDRDGSPDEKAWNFTIPVTPDGMDGPYQPRSRWGFRAMATFADVETEPTGYIVGLCPACFAYDISYHITILAIREPEA